MPPIQLGRIDSAFDDALDLVQRDLETLAGVNSPRLAFEVNLTLHTSTGDAYPLAIKVQRSGLVEGRPYSFETSHHAKTPDQIGPYITSLPYEDSLLSAIHHAIESVRSYVDRAIEKGRRFDAAWLVPNPHY